MCTQVKVEHAPFLLWSGWLVFTPIESHKRLGQNWSPAQTHVHQTRAQITCHLHDEKIVLGVVECSRYLQLAHTSSALASNWRGHDAHFFDVEYDVLGGRGYLHLNGDAAAHVERGKVRVQIDLVEQWLDIGWKTNLRPWSLLYDLVVRITGTLLRAHQGYHNYHNRHHHNQRHNAQFLPQRKGSSLDLSGADQLVDVVHTFTIRCDLSIVQGYLATIFSCTVLGFPERNQICHLLWFTSRAKGWVVQACRTGPAPTERKKLHLRCGKLRLPIWSSPTSDTHLTSPSRCVCWVLPRISNSGADARWTKGGQQVWSAALLQGSCQSHKEDETALHMHVHWSWSWTSVENQLQKETFTWYGTTVCDAMLTQLLLPWLWHVGQPAYAVDYVYMYNYISHSSHFAVQLSCVAWVDLL